MAIRCGFFDSRDGDRKYSAEEMNEPYKHIISDGVLVPNEDLPGELTNVLGVTAGVGLNVIVKQGRGIFAGKWFVLDEDMTLPMPSNGTSSNIIASVIVRIDARADVRSGSIEVITNNNNTIPQINTIENVHEFRLANVTITPGAQSVTDKIQDTRATDDCGFCHGLIKQLSTDELFRQWEDAFNNWFSNVQVSLKTQATLVTTITSGYTTTSSQTDIPIQISQYNVNLDDLEVYISGIAVEKGTDYTIVDNSTIRLSQAVNSGTRVMFRVFKSIDGSQAETIVQVVQDMLQDVTDMRRDVNALMTTVGTSSTDWITFTLEGGAIGVENMEPQVRKVGNIVYIRGAVYNVSNNQQVVCTLPEDMAPVMEHYVSHVAGGTGAGVGYTSVRIRVNRKRASGGTATITLNGSTSPLNVGMTIPLSMSFIVE